MKKAPLLFCTGLLMSAGSALAQPRLDMVAHGQEVFRMAGCENCHTDQQWNSKRLWAFFTRRTSALTRKQELAVGARMISGALFVKAEDRMEQTIIRVSHIPPTQILVIKTFTRYGLT
jgi:cytochrome c2